MLIEGVSEDGLFFRARSYGEAPEIDPEIYLLNEYPDDLSLVRWSRAKLSPKKATISLLCASVLMRSTFAPRLI